MILIHFFDSMRLFVLFIPIYFMCYTFRRRNILMESNVKASFLCNWAFFSRVVLFFTMVVFFTSVLELNLSKVEPPVEKIAFLI